MYAVRLTCSRQCHVNQCQSVLDCLWSRRCVLHAISLGFSWQFTGDFSAGILFCSTCVVLTLLWDCFDWMDWILYGLITLPILLKLVILSCVHWRLRWASLSRRVWFLDRSRELLYAFTYIISCCGDYYIVYGVSHCEHMMPLSIKNCLMTPSTKCDTLYDCTVHIAL